MLLLQTTTLSRKKEWSIEKLVLCVLYVCIYYVSNFSDIFQLREVLNKLTFLHFILERVKRSAFSCIKLHFRPFLVNCVWINKRKGCVLRHICMFEKLEQLLTVCSNYRCVSVLSIRQVIGTAYSMDNWR